MSLEDARDKRARPPDGWTLRQPLRHARRVAAQDRVEHPELVNTPRSPRAAVVRKQLRRRP